MDAKWKYLTIILVTFGIMQLLLSLIRDDFSRQPSVAEQNKTCPNNTVMYKSQPSPRQDGSNLFSFLDSPYYQSKIFNSNKHRNKFLNPYVDFMSFAPKPKSEFRFNYIHFDHNYDNPQIIHCSGINKAGIGNFLAQYWAARAVAFWLGYNFKVVINNEDSRCWQDQSTVNEMFQKYFDSNTHNKYWLYYLPKSINISIYDNDKYKLSNTDRNRIYVWITQSIVQLTADDRKKYLYKSVYRLFYYNPVFINVLISETRTALNAYFLKSENNSNILPNPLFKSHKDIVIHFRCGDILHAGYKEYGFMTKAFFAKAFDLIRNKLNLTIDASMNIWFLSQLGHNSLRSDDLLGKNNLERKYLNGCNKVVYRYVDELKKLVFPAQINIYGNNPLNLDFYMMVHAPVLICSMSTFCEQSALANTNKVILPLWGPWNDLKDMLEGNIWYPKNHYFIHNSETELTLTSSTIRKRNMNEDQIVQYLISH